MSAAEVDFIDGAFYNGTVTYFEGWFVVHGVVFGGVVEVWW